MDLPFTCGFEDSDICDIEQSEDDEFDWKRKSGSSPTGGTGPSRAQEGSYYLFTEATDTSSGDIARYVSFLGTKTDM